MLAEIGDITRFGSARKLASWAGLTPTVRGSDLTVRHGHISKQGPAWLRWVMNQAAQTAKRSPEFAASYAAIAKRRGTTAPAELTITEATASEDVLLIRATTRIDRYAHGLTRAKGIAGRHLAMEITARATRS